MIYVFLVLAVLFLVFVLWCVTYDPGMIPQSELDSIAESQMREEGLTES